MSLSVKRITNANVYVNGASFLGKSEEVTLPEVSAKMSDHKVLGAIGELELPAGVQKMSAKIKWNSVDPDAMAMAGNFYEAVRIQVRGSLEDWQGGTRGEQVPLVAFLTVTSKKIGGLGFKPQDNVENESEFNVTSYKLEIGGREIYHIDVANNIYRVNGVDMMAKYRENLGI